MSRPKPGLVFSLVCDVGFAIGMVTHDVPRVGSLVWMAQPTFDEEPTVERIGQIDRWRWPVFFPLAAAIRRNIVTPIGVVSVPPDLQKVPVIRSRDGRDGWTLVRFVNGSSQPCGVATDPAVPRYRVVNDTTLKEMLVSGYAPERDW
jgi:hypothetical protein